MYISSRECAKTLVHTARIIYIASRYQKQLMLVLQDRRPHHRLTFFKNKSQKKYMYCNASNPVSKITDKRPQYNQRERGIPNQVGNPRDGIYREVLQDWLPWDQTNVGQRKSELLMRFHLPGIGTKGIDGNYRVITLF